MNETSWVIIVAVGWLTLLLIMIAGSVCESLNRVTKALERWRWQQKRYQDKKS